MEPRPFHDRTEAGQLLAGKLAAYANRADVIVLGLPRGGGIASGGQNPERLDAAAWPLPAPRRRPPVERRRRHRRSGEDVGEPVRFRVGVLQQGTGCAGRLGAGGAARFRRQQ